MASSRFALAREPGAARVTPSGELDLAVAPRLAEALSTEADDAVLVILDLSELTFIESSGPQTILTAHARLREADRRLVLVPGSPAVQRIFELTRTDGVLEFVRPPDDDLQPWDPDDDASPVWRVRLSRGRANAELVGWPRRSSWRPLARDSDRLDRVALASAA